MSTRWSTIVGLFARETKWKAGGGGDVRTRTSALSIIDLGLFQVTRKWKAGEERIAPPHWSSHVYFSFSSKPPPFPRDWSQPPRKCVCASKASPRSLVTAVSTDHDWPIAEVGGGVAWGARAFRSSPNSSHVKTHIHGRPSLGWMDRSIGGHARARGGRARRDLVRGRVCPFHRRVVVRSAQSSQLPTPNAINQIQSSSNPIVIQSTPSIHTAHPTQTKPTQPCAAPSPPSPPSRGSPATVAPSSTPPASSAPVTGSPAR